MPKCRIEDVEDKRLEPFRHIRQRTWVAGSGIFIAEGRQLVETLVESDYFVESILVDEKFDGRFADWLPGDATVLLVPHELVRHVTGFDFHRGILACGRRKQMPTLSEIDIAAGRIGVGLVGVEDQENMGSILRTCSAFGVDSVVVGPRCCDPLSRRSLRVSMGNALRMRLVQCRDDLELSHCLASNKFCSVATSLREGAIPLGEARLPSLNDQGRMLWFGNEYRGLPGFVLDACDAEIGLEMHGGTDSLNVSVAAGIFIHHFCAAGAVGRTL
jgi:tRNA G18 (ribose-2'-O)-methylase SpoU